jgi:ferredoxin
MRTLYALVCLVVSVDAFQVATPKPSISSTALCYEPKWKKKETLAETLGPASDLKEIGLIGTIPVVFKQGDETRKTMAIAGQPLREVAIQAGQFIKYGCGKGECGTCEALVNGQWVRPCSILVPADLQPGQEYVVQVKAVKNKAKSSGKFYSVRSFLFGFYNNVLGMVGMVKYKRNAKKNWEERREYEEMIRQKTLEKKKARAAAMNNDKKLSS